ncbi:thionin-like protein 2 [Pyrus ussuriensis x Pyrus communis]|uniref:Thionin-like protein 2 n=1 Tax=Pyrus ussuriensis x Pyrus communis TaxID=2448454 RepID=A0A5N5H7C1_9ROSA|nr:thionin-like protein 2 [Pyrus ussuriensis x Pyrus communis]
MDKKGLRPVPVAYLVLGMLMLAGQSSASFKSCYESCFILCVITPNHSVSYCSFQCLKDCIIPSRSPLDHSNIHKDNVYFCKLGCASSLCSNLSTKQNPEVEKVGGCVDSCSETCTIKNT